MTEVHVSEVDGDLLRVAGALWSQLLSIASHETIHSPSMWMADGPSAPDYKRPANSQGMTGRSDLTIGDWSRDASTVFWHVAADIRRSAGAENRGDVRGEQWR